METEFEMVKHDDYVPAPLPYITVHIFYWQPDPFLTVATRSRAALYHVKATPTFYVL